MKKTCPRCKRELKEDDFNWKIKNVRRAYYCRDCSRQYVKDHYKNNKRYYLSKAKKRNILARKAVFEYIGSYLSQHACVDCGEDDILVLEFDHRDRNEKTSEISKMIRQRISMKRVAEEISKCDVRCANCHRRKSQKESGSWKLKYAPVA
jgi:hypothetical protein